MDNRKRYIIAAVVAVVVIALAGVLIWWFSRAGEQRDIVPDNAVAAMRLDFKKLMEQAEIDRSQLKDVDNETGIDFRQTVYGFVTPEGNIGLAAAVSDDDDLDDHLSGIRKRSGLTYGMLGTFIACHDGDKVLLMGPMASLHDEALMDEMAKLMDKDECTCVLLDSAEVQDAPLSIRTSVSALPGRIRNLILPTSIKSLSAEALQMQISGMMKENKISMTASLVTGNESLREHIDKMLASLKPLTGNLVHQGPQDPVIWLAVGVKGNEILDVLRSNESIRTALLGANMCVDLDQMIKATDGDVQLSVSKLSLRQQEWIIDAQVDDESFMKNASDWDMDKMHTYFGMAAPGVLYATNSMNQMQLAHETSPNTSLMLQMNQIKGSYLYATVNLKPLINTIAPAMMMLGYGKSFYNTVDYLNHLTFRIDDKAAAFDIVLDQNLSEIVRSWKK